MQNNNTSGPIFQPWSDPWPWAPFKTLADFEYTETAIQSLLLKINSWLASTPSGWLKADLMAFLLRLVKVFSRN